jgi:transcriptional regulator with XRE-family HTH domain
MDLLELGAALSAGRARLQPVDVGLPAGSRRRVPGLRREEVAMLAGISVDYLIRLEQGRGPRPSGQVLGALARALQLTSDERDRLYRLAGSEPPSQGRIDSLVRRSTLRLLQRLVDLPAMVIDAKGDLLAWNDLALALIGDVTALSHEQRNFNRLAFSPPGDAPRRVVYDTSDDRDQAAAEHVSDLRAVAAKYPDDPDLARLIDDLQRHSPTFARLWDEGRVELRRSSVKTFDHPDVGRLTLDCDVTILPDTDQRLIIYSAEPDSPDWSALGLLRVVGIENLAPTDATDD